MAEPWDYVITVCGDANEVGRAFFGTVTHRLHMGSDDPSQTIGTDDFIWCELMRVRDEIKAGFYEIYNK